MDRCSSTPQAVLSQGEPCEPVKEGLRQKRKKKEQMAGGAIPFLTETKESKSITLFILRQEIFANQL